MIQDYEVTDASVHDSQVFEDVFGVQMMRAGNLLIRTVGLIRAKTKIGLRNLAYNIDRFCLLSLV